MGRAERRSASLGGGDARRGTGGLLTAVDASGVDISIVIPVYRAEPYIRSCLEALLAQDLSPTRYEVLFVDNRSPDASRQIIEEYLEATPHFRLLSEPERGAYAARNRGIRETTGELVAFTDPDCVPSAGWLRRLTAPLRDGTARVVVGRSLLASDGPALRLLNEYEHHRNRRVFTSRDPAVYYGYTNNLATRRATLERFGLFERRARGADVIFVRRVVDRYGPGSIVYEAGATVEHLEVDSLARYFRKMFIYARSQRSYGRSCTQRQLPAAERLEAFRRAGQDAGMGLTGRATLLGILVAGLLPRWAGSAAGRLDRADPR